VIVAAAFCPNPPVLVADVAGVRAGELDPMRVAAATAIGRLRDSDPDQIAVIGAGPTSLAHSPLARGSLAGFGIPLEVQLGSPGCGGALELPLSLTVGATLLAGVVGDRSGAVGFSVGPDFAASRAAVELLALVQERRVGLLVMGDGSARRSTAAPGYLDEAAAPFDAGVEKILAAGDPAGLAEFDADEGERLLAAGVPAWLAAAGVFTDDSYAAELLYADAPYGVGYFVASWLARG
jgi:hypothetical protein